MDAKYVTHSCNIIPKKQTGLPSMSIKHSTTFFVYLASIQTVEVRRKNEDWHEIAR